MESQSSFDAYRMPDAMWEKIRLLLPDYETCLLGGRPRRDLRSVADAIFYRLRTGCQWKAIPKSLAPGSTALSCSEKHGRKCFRLQASGQDIRGLRTCRRIRQPCIPPTRRQPLPWYSKRKCQPKRRSPLLRGKSLSCVSFVLPTSTRT